MGDESRQGWTIETYAAHHAALREADLALQAERDRRYAEVAAEREKTLLVKQDADRMALRLAREIQDYKDEKANELREQINRERGLYATKDDLSAAVARFEALLAPVKERVTIEHGRGVGYASSWNLLLGLAALIVTMIAIGSFVFRAAPTLSAPPAVTRPAP